ncbi:MULTISPECIES: DUF4124 domain-containing protein [Pseudoalteromonas]|jgi:hypothetical protein|uniref:DUF4124 domain-containing protein n=1 Tax=Pseudoalteromonas aliena SW19 TaxID=1314866 RepID=A0ABR9E265_9GAMM|nr:MULTISPECIES: DUF4124 domain-containing protein [Pseudoalteromonas]MBE0359544.1 hypothetical protein [Pseudoalteromonas aliena SW19]TMN96344.1 hypothetical protein CWB66_17750 [Pseudoalteromonas sp. S558]
MCKHSRYFLYVFCFSISLCSNATTYYKCVTAKGTIFSQFPCDDQATTYKVNTTNVLQTAPKTDYNKQLNDIERERILSMLQAQLRSNNHKLAILDREKQRDEYKQQQRLSHILSDDDKKRIAKDITKQIKLINKTHKKEAFVISKKIKKLEKEITLYQQTK